MGGTSDRTCAVGRAERESGPQLKFPADASAPTRLETGKSGFRPKAASRARGQLLAEIHFFRSLTAWAHLRLREISVGAHFPFLPVPPHTCGQMYRPS